MKQSENIRKRGMNSVVDRASLEDRLHKLAAAGLGEQDGRTFRAATPEGLLRAVLSELDTVVMPREVRLEVVGGKVLPIEAANRRILSYGPDAEVDWRGIDPSDAEASEGLKKRLLDMIGDAKSVKLTYVPMERDFDPTETGISVAALAEGWNARIGGGGELGEFLDTLMALAGDDGLVLGWLVQEGEVIESIGNEDIADGLRELNESNRSTELLESAGPADAAWRFAAVTDDADGDVATVVACHGSTRILMAVAPGKLGEITDVWRQALAS